MTDTSLQETAEKATLRNVYHLLLECRGMKKCTSGDMVGISPPRFPYNQTGLMVTTVLEVKLFVWHAGMHIFAEENSFSVIKYKF